jgi:hypothetical protein
MARSLIAVVSRIYPRICLRCSGLRIQQLRRRAGNGTKPDLLAIGQWQNLGSRDSCGLWRPIFLTWRAPEGFRLRLRSGDVDAEWLRTKKLWEVAGTISRTGALRKMGPDLAPSSLTPSTIFSPCHPYVQPRKHLFTASASTSHYGYCFKGRQCGPVSMIFRTQSSRMKPVRACNASGCFAETSLCDIHRTN